LCIYISPIIKHKFNIYVTNLPSITHITVVMKIITNNTDQTD